MDGTIGGAVMAKPRGRPKKSERDDVAVKLDRTMASRAKTLAGYRGISVAELITETLRGPFDRMFNEMIRQTEGKG